MAWDGLALQVELPAVKLIPPLTKLMASKLSVTPYPIMTIMLRLVLVWLMMMAVSKSCHDVETRQYGRRLVRDAKSRPAHDH